MTNVQLRRAWFQVHKWIGLILAIVIIPLSLTGSVLVWDGPVDHLLNPQRYATSGTTLLSAKDYVAAARSVLKPDNTIASLEFPEGSGPVIVRATTPEGGRARTSVWIDPSSARVLEVADAGSGALRVMHRIHGSLMIPGVGRKIVGWVGIAMMLSCFTGIWLWWPTVGRWIKGLRWRRHNNLDTNLHHLMGFWIALPLFVLSLTGAWISFPGLFAPKRGDGPPRPRATAPIAAPHMAPDAVLAAARQASDGAVESLAWPTAGKAPKWTIATQTRNLTLNDKSGEIATAPQRQHGGPGLSGVMRRVHDGEGLGIIWQTIIVIGGILPAILALTGVIMWWRARSWRKAQADRMKTVRATG